MLPYFLSERSIMTFFSRKHLRLLLLPALLLLTGCAGSAKETADSTETEKLSAGIEKMVNAAFDGVEKSTESEDKPSTSFRE